jgi:hypothetical protein
MVKYVHEEKCVGLWRVGKNSNKFPNAVANVRVFRIKRKGAINIKGLT